MPAKDPFTLPEWITKEQKQMIMSCREIVEKEVFPLRTELDEDWKEHKLYGPLTEKFLLDFGFQSAIWPKEFGGDGFDFTTYCLIIEEISRGDVGLTCTCDPVNWAFLPIIAPFRNEKLIKKFAPIFCQNEKVVIACCAITDQSSGSDVENIDGTHGKYITTTAKLDGDEWVINGHKQWPSNAGGMADYFAIWCTTNPGIEDDNAIAIIYAPADTPGITQGSPYQKAGCAGDKNSDIWFENVRIPKENRASLVPGQDAISSRYFLCAGAIGSSAMAIGMMRAVYELVKDYCSKRVVAGKVLKEHTINAAVLADIASLIELSRSDTYLKLRMFDKPELFGIDPTGPEMLAKARINKQWVTDQLVNVCNMAMDLMGSNGYAREGLVEKYWRDGKILSVWMGGRALAQLDIARWFYDCKTF